MFTKRDIERYGEVLEELTRRPDVVSITIRVDSGELLKVFSVHNEPAK